MNQNPMVLIVEDEEGISNFLSAVLQAGNYQLIKASTGKDAISMMAAYGPDLMLLDLGLPDMDGIDVIKRIREWSVVPIIVVSARVNEREKVQALDSGADDYITKPFGTSELLARIRTEIRHGRNRTATGTEFLEKTIIGDLVIDYLKRVVLLRGSEIHFTPIEFKIIGILAQHPGKVITHDTIVKEIWGPYANEVQTLRVNMANIRRKLEENPAEPRYILTEVGVGYRLAEEAQSLS